MSPAPAYITRSIEPVLRRAAAQFPVVVLSGPRQSGKTTLLRHLFGASHTYVSLEPPDVRAAATHDPRGFLRQHPSPVTFDEVQYVPDLLPYIKELVDARRDTPGQFLLTGSQNLSLAADVSESLAGRAAILRLLPMSRREAEGRPHLPLPWSPDRHPETPSPVAPDPWPDLLRGGYPELVRSPRRDLHLWHASYVQTYLERDVRSLRQVGDLSQFQAFLSALAARSGQLLNLSDLGRDLGLAVNTVKAWLSVLEATYQVVILRPYHANLGKRLVKSPRVYFTDTGTLCYLTGLRDPAHAASGPLGGVIMETAVVAELARTLTHLGQDPRLYFWRTAAGSEVDLLVDTGARLVPLEVKLSATPRPAMADGIRRFQVDLGSQATPGYVVHPGASRLPLGPGATALPYADL